MSELERLVSAQDDLIQALDRGDVLALETATAAMKQIIALLRSEGIGEQLRPRLEHALRQGDAARVRVNFLADRTRHRLDRLARHRHSTSASIYNAAGQIAQFGKLA